MPISLILLGFLLPLMSLALLRMARHRHGTVLGAGRIQRKARARAEVTKAILRRRLHRRAVLHRVLHPPP